MPAVPARLLQNMLFPELPENETILVLLVSFLYVYLGYILSSRHSSLVRIRFCSYLPHRPCSLHMSHLVLLNLHGQGFDDLAYLLLTSL